MRELKNAFNCFQFISLNKPLVMESVFRKIKHLNANTHSNSLQIYQKSIEFCTKVGGKVGLGVTSLMHKTKFNGNLILLISDILAYFCVRFDRFCKNFKFMHTTLISENRMLIDGIFLTVYTLHFAV